MDTGEGRSGRSVDGSSSRRSLLEVWVIVSLTGLLLSPSQLIHRVQGQTEGDMGYEDNEAYGEEYEEDTVIGMDPIFDVPIVNVTVVKGQTAVLPCSIDYLGKHKVAWLDHLSIPLSYEERRVVDDLRFSVVRPGIKEWNLQIREVRREDEGQYRCTINTNQVKNKIVMLHVKVPAEIIDEWSSGDVTVQEGDTVVLRCNVTGVPTPQVTWTRPMTSSYRAPLATDQHQRQKLDSCQLMIESLSDEVVSVLGASLVLQNVSRYCDGWFECTAGNGVPPTVSRRVRVTVEFGPKIEMPNLRIGQQLGRETILECSITAFPHAVNYWEKEGRRITSSMKHRIEAYEESDHTITLSLKIHITDVSDFGEYTCVAANSFGRAEASMLLYDYTEDERRSAAALEASMNHHQHPTNSRVPLDHVIRYSTAAPPIRIEYRVTPPYMDLTRMGLARGQGHSIYTQLSFCSRLVTIVMVGMVMRLVL